MNGIVVVLFVTSLSLVVHGLTDAEKQKINLVHSDCQSNPTTHVDEEVLKRLNRGEDVDKSKVGAHILCMSTKLGMQNENGDIIEAGIKNRLARVIHDQDKLDSVVRKCTVQKDTPEDTALVLLRCIRENTDRSVHADHQH